MQTNAGSQLQTELMSNYETLWGLWKKVHFPDCANEQRDHNVKDLTKKHYESKKYYI